MMWVFKMANRQVLVFYGNQLKNIFFSYLSQICRLVDDQKLSSIGCGGIAILYMVLHINKAIFMIYNQDGYVQFRLESYSLPATRQFFLTSFKAYNNKFTYICALQPSISCSLLSTLPFTAKIRTKELQLIKNHHRPEVQFILSSPKQKNTSG